MHIDDIGASSLILECECALRSSWGYRFSLQGRRCFWNWGSFKPLPGPVKVIFEYDVRFPIGWAISLTIGAARSFPISFRPARLNNAKAFSRPAKSCALLLTISFPQFCFVYFARFVPGQQRSSERIENSSRTVDFSSLPG